MRSRFVSVVMPMYNAEATVRDAIESVLAQTMSKLELIVVDDGSTDASLDIAHRFAKLDSRIRIVEGSHEGVSPAMNLGLRESRSDWVARMDADDICEKTRLEEQVNHLMRNDALVALGSFGWRVSASGRIVAVYDEGPTTVAEFERMRTAGEMIWMIQPSVLMSRAHVLGVGGYRKIQHEDLDVYQRLADKHVILALPRRLIRVRIGSGITMDGLRTDEGARAFVKACTRARRAGLPEPDVEVFWREYREGLRWWGRAGEYRRFVARSHYRRAGQHFAERRWLAGASRMAVSLATSPSLALSRIRKQVVPLVLTGLARQ